MQHGGQEDEGGRGMDMDKVHIAEVFSPVRVAMIGKEYGLTAGASMDLKTCWDFTKEEDRSRAWKA